MRYLWLAWMFFGGLFATWHATTHHRESVRWLFGLAAVICFIAVVVTLMGV